MIYFEFEMSLRLCFLIFVQGVGALATFSIVSSFSSSPFQSFLKCKCTFSLFPYTFTMRRSARPFFNCILFVFKILSFPLYIPQEAELSPISQFPFSFFRKCKCIFSLFPWTFPRRRSARKFFILLLTLWIIRCPSRGWLCSYGLNLIILCYKICFFPWFILSSKCPSRLCYLIFVQGGGALAVFLIVSSLV